MQVDTFKLQGPPQSFDHAIIEPAAAPVHRNLMLGMLLPDLRLWIYRRKTHEPNQPSHTVAAAFMTLSSHMTHHLPRTAPWGLEELLINDFYEF